ncbi:MAG: alpha-ketoglutarate-dependent dioxygenase AlkB [Proteobacteria bacterium]|nr:alpha-ketoglutarate-dependent dioxygenase AlkB [Pseudomonadota bacterium]
MAQRDLFDETARLPSGLVYVPEFLTAAEEDVALAGIGTLALREARFREYFAKRRVAHFHTERDAPYYEEGSADDVDHGPLPAWLVALRARVAAHLALPAEALVHALVSEYRPGTPIGWHRDKPVYGIIAGLSLAGTGTMRWRPLAAQDAAHTVSLELAPRSLYVMRDAIRADWQHSMPPMKALRYSITLRTRAT